MKIILAFVVIFLSGNSAFSNCNNAYASAGYSLSHAKKSMSANNFQHQQYYAERALTAFEKARTQNESCGCEGAIDPILDGIENLETALNQTEWDMGRFYTKKALENAEQLLNNLDVCTTGVTYNEVQASEENDFSSTEEILPDEAEIAKTDEWEVKLYFKQKAETDLADLERSIRELATLFECEKALKILKERNSKTEEELRSEGLDEVKAFYMSQVVSLHNKALFAMLECSKK